jgi:hypothetical protein
VQLAQFQEREMNDNQRMAKIDDLLAYFRKGKPNNLVEDTIREKLTALSDENFNKALDRLLQESNRFGINLDTFNTVINGLGLGDNRTSGYVHKAEEVQCDCCGHHYFWSVTADDEIAAEKNWWALCPMCGFHGDWQQSAHATVKQTGKEPEAYRAMLDRQYRFYAERGFQPIKTQRGIRESSAAIKQGGYKDWKNVQSIISDLENSYKERQRRYAEAQKEKVL